MDIYDHIEEQALSPASEKQPPTISSDDPSTSTEAPNLREDLESALRAAQTSQWGSTLNSWFSSARKQGEVFYQDLTKEAAEAQVQATKGFSSLREQVVQRTRGMSLNTEPGATQEGKGEGIAAGASAEAEALEPEQGGNSEIAGGRAENLPADIVKEASTLVASLKSTAASRLRDLQRAEDAADEALLKFGTNVRNFLRDAVTISAPPEDDSEGQKEVLFETSDPGTGRKVFHSTRLDAQLHAIHTTSSSFTSDPASGENWEDWNRDFNIEGQTDEIAKDLEAHEDLRRAMEKLVPEKVEYRTFWCRYYFLRKAVEEEERRRREVLKGATEEEEVAWDDDDDEQNTSVSTPSNAVKGNHAASASTTTLTQPASESLKPNEPRRSHDDAKSVADSDASYDIVSGATSRAMGSPKEALKEGREAGKEESDDDWE